jgi:type II secretory pathway pseudopilin PulG
MKEVRTGLAHRVEQGEDGFMLVGLIVAIFLILLAMSVAAPRVAQDLRRDREVEAVHRGNQYVRAIRLYYRKMNSTYPGSMEQLEKSNNIRFLRQRYVDPMTGKDDWRLIHVGEAKTTVKGFFGQPLVGLAPGLGTAAGMTSPGIGGSSPAPGGLGSSSPGGLGSSSPGSGLGGLGSGSATGGATTAAPGATAGATPGTDSSASGQTSTLGSAGAIASTTTTSSFTGGGGAGPFVGVGTPKEGDSITVLNEQTTYNTWEFIYDPRIEQMYAKASLFGGGPATGGTGLGSASDMKSGFGTTPTTPGIGGMPGTPSPTAPTNPTTPTSPQQPQ